MSNRLSRRSFLTNTAFGATLASFGGALAATPDEPAKPKIQGFDETDTDVDPNAEWKPFTDKKLRVGIVGFGLCGQELERRDRRRLRPLPRAPRRARQSLPLRKDLRIAGRDDQRRLHRGDFYRDRRPEPLRSRLQDLEVG